MTKYKIAFLAVSAAFVLGGCAVTQKDVDHATNDKLKTSNDVMAGAKNQQKQEGRVTRIKSNYLGGAAIEMTYASQLPQQFFETISLRSKGGGFGTVAQAAKNINLATGIPVRVNPDVDVRVVTASPGVGGVGAGLNDLVRDMPSASSIQTNSSTKPVRLDYQGTLIGYVRDVANAGGVEWEYTDGSINFFRMVTKTFNLSNASPGDIDMSDSMTKGGSASTGQAGGQGGTSTGGFTSTSSVGVKGKYNFWTLFKDQLATASTIGGKIAINEGTGTITVTDTKDAVGKIEKMILRENAILGRQVSVDVRVIKVDINKGSESGVNLNAVYSLFNSAGAVTRTATFGAPGSLTTAAAGSLTFAVKDPTSSFTGSTAAIQALNTFGNIVSDNTSTVVTSNRVPAMSGQFSTKGFLAQTTPATGGAVAGGAGVPGLTPGSVTTGSFMRILPTIRDNNTVMLNLSVDLSDLLGLGSATTGEGSTMQQIQWANTSGNKTISSLLLNQDEAMVMVGIGGDGVNSSEAYGIGGGSRTANKTKSIFVIVVTPRIMKSI
jgi:type IVB pilus formation R64 PilN family outer membrane protein